MQPVQKESNADKRARSSQTRSGKRIVLVFTTATPVIMLVLLLGYLSMFRLVLMVAAITVFMVVVILAHKSIGKRLFDKTFQDAQ